MQNTTNNSSERMITVFGGSGFLGRRVVDQLLDQGFTMRVAVRHPDGVKERDGLSAVKADVRDRASIARALKGAAGVVNAVSLYVESGGVTYDDIHVKGAMSVAEEAAKHNVKRLVSLSGIGADAASSSPYIRARGLGEEAVRRAFPEAVIVRPSVLFGPGDAFFNTFAKILKRAPVLPLFGGSCRLQPVFVDDVAEAIGALLTMHREPAGVYEFGGPEIKRLDEMVKDLQRFMGIRRLVMPVPLPLADVAARLSELLPNAPLSRGQVDLLREDNLANPSLPGLTELGVTPTSYKTVVPTYLKKA